MESGPPPPTLVVEPFPNRTRPNKCPFRSRSSVHSQRVNYQVSLAWGQVKETGRSIERFRIKIKNFHSMVIACPPKSLKKDAQARPSPF
ncbi:hypothetical protein TNIN_251491 [Trichonephila inaurata madagascariensis]|uniref:Uncharacterized protein n=1 Tax=Trichonephila inaurata madagascariensis TaxID=2747483 RepID=A0A8X7CBJ1_9ARAC|nr:hypothetical protein TNIN_251491 [Trichonephila inaurata madagascariensis]